MISFLSEYEKLYYCILFVQNFTWPKACLAICKDRPCLPKGIEHDFWSRFLLPFSFFSSLFFLGGKRKEKQNNQSRGQKSYLSDRSLKGHVPFVKPDIVKNLASTTHRQSTKILRFLLLVCSHEGLFLIMRVNKFQHV